MMASLGSDKNLMTRNLEFNGVLWVLHGSDNFLSDRYRPSYLCTVRTYVHTMHVGRYSITLMNEHNHPLSDVIVSVDSLNEHSSVIIYPEG